MKAHLNNLRMSPRKVRLVADAIRGKRVPEALATLAVLPKAAVAPLRKLLLSGARNAEYTGGRARSELFIREMRVDAGPTLKRYMPRARGSSARIRKRTSRVTLILGHSRRSEKPFPVTRS